MSSDKILLDRAFFEHLLNCLANQKYINNPLSLSEGISYENQQAIDKAWNEGMVILRSKSFTPKTNFLCDLWERLRCK